MAFPLRPIRRHERQLASETALELLKQGEWGLLALVDPDGAPYGVPMSYALEWAPDAAGDVAAESAGACPANAWPDIVMHMGVEGRKIECLTHEPRAAFTVVGPTEVLPDKFSTCYASVMAFGTMIEIGDEVEKIHLLRLLAAKYSPGFETGAAAYAQAAVGKTRLWRLHVEGVSAKGRQR